MTNQPEDPVEALFLVRRRKSDYIHTSKCRHATTLDASRWTWADKNPDVDWEAMAPWLKPCKRCNPPSPFKAGKS